MKKKFKILIIGTLAPLMLLTACNGNENNELADPQDVNYDPVSFTGENPYLNGNEQAGENGNNPNIEIRREGRAYYTHRFMGPGDPRTGSPNYAQDNQQPQAQEREQPAQEQPVQEPEVPETDANRNQGAENEQAGNQAMDKYVQQVIDLTNGERKKNGLPALKPHGELSNVARIKSEDMVNKNYFSHTSPTYGSPFEMMENFGIEYSTAAENIAAGQETPQEVVQAWMDSPGHRKNIMNAQVTHIGVGYAEDGRMGIYWTQMFIK